jgi:hypothetical protein
MENIKQHLSKIVAGVLLLVLILLWIMNPSKDKSVNQATPIPLSSYSDTTKTLVKRKPLSQLEPLKEVKKTDRETSSYHANIVKNISYNTMGTYELPPELHDKLMLDIDTAILNHMNDLVKAYSKYKLNILASDTTHTVVFQKVK